MTIKEDAEALHLDDEDVAHDDRAAEASDTEPDEAITVDDLDDLSDIEIDDLSDLEGLDQPDDLSDLADDDSVLSDEIDADAPTGSRADQLRDNVLDIEDRRIQLHEIREARTRVRTLTPLFAGFGGGLLIGRMGTDRPALLLAGAILFILLAVATWLFGVWLERAMRHDAGAILEQLDDTNRQLDEVLSGAAID